MTHIALDISAALGAGDGRGAEAGAEAAGLEVLPHDLGGMATGSPTNCRSCAALRAFSSESTAMPSSMGSPMLPVAAAA